MNQIAVMVGDEARFAAPQSRHDAMATTRFINPTTFSSNPYIQALISDQVWLAGDTITYYLKPTDWNGNRNNDLNEKGAGSAITAAYAAFAAVANIRSQAVANPADATWIEQVVQGGNGATHYLPFVRNPAIHDLGGQYSILDADPAEFVKGGQWYSIVLHEIGHGLGLEHTHESGRFPGVASGDADAAGDNGLNSELYSIMSYNTVTRFTYGTPATPMAFDIAAVQALYGANMTTATGNDSYVLPTHNTAGTYYACIWDAGGNDTLSVGIDATTGATLDLRAATLRNEAGGGGYLSSVNGIEGGFTIADGVVIENATGSNYADVMVGNAASNRLTGNGGADQLSGLDGNDTLLGGSGADVLAGGTGLDRMDGGADGDTYYVDETDLITDTGTSGTDTVIVSFVSGTAASNTYYLSASIENLILADNVAIGAGNASANYLQGNGLVNALYGGDGADTLVGLSGQDWLQGDAGADFLYGGSENDVLGGGADADWLLGEAGDDAIWGDGGNDVISGDIGNDYITGGAGYDLMYGGAGNDVFVVGRTDQEDIIFGEAGGDTVLFVDRSSTEVVSHAIEASGYTTVRFSDGSYTSLSGVEFLAFTDTSLFIG